MTVIPVLPATPRAVPRVSRVRPATHRNGSRRPATTTIAVTLGVAATVGWLAWNPPDLAALSAPAVVSWWWLGAALVACAGSFWAAGVVVQAASPVRLRAGVAATAQLASAATKLVTPASVGVVGLNARLLNRHGVSVSNALASVAAAQLAQLVVTVSLLLALSPWATDVLPSPNAINPWWTAASAVVVAVAAVAVHRLRGAQRLRNGLVCALRSLATLASGGRLGMLAAASTALTCSLAFCLWACVAALGGSADPVAVTVVLLVGSALGSLLPTPGGVGGVEGAMVAGLLATGLAAEVALPAVLAFRLVTFWLPMPFGVVALTWLRRRGHV